MTLTMKLKNLEEKAVTQAIMVLAHEETWRYWHQDRFGISFLLQAIISYICTYKDIIIVDENHPLCSRPIDTNQFPRSPRPAEAHPQSSLSLIYNAFHRKRFAYNFRKACRVAWRLVKVDHASHISDIIISFSFVLRHTLSALGVDQRQVLHEKFSRRIGQ